MVAVLVAFAAMIVAVRLPTSDASYTSSGMLTNTFASSTAYSYSTLITNSTPWLWWRLGDTAGSTAADSSGNSRTGTLSTAGISRGIDGAILGDASTAYHVDGSAGCIAGGTTQVNPTTFTAEAWFRTTTADGGLIVGFGSASTVPSGSTTNDRQVFLTAAGKVAFGTVPSSAQTITSPGTYNDGRWHIVDGVLSPGGGAKLYVDGVLVGSGAAGAANSTNAWRAGCGTVNPSFTGAPTAGYLAADLDEIAVYTTALTASAVADRMTAAPSRRPYAETVKNAAPWAYWRLGEGNSATMTDASPNADNGTTSSSGLISLQSGAVAGSTATTFDGTAGCAVATAAVANPNTFTLEAWFNTTSSVGGPIIGFMDNSTANTTGSTKWDRHVYLNSTGTVSFGVFSSGVRQVVSSGVGGFNDGAWHHVVATLGATGQILYLDGVAVALGATTTAQNFTGYWHVGCQSVSSSWSNFPGSSYFDGSIDEVAVYTRALDAPIVQQHFRSGAAPPDYPTVVSASAPWAWWRLGELSRHELVDSSGNNDRGWTSDGGITRGLPGVLGADAAMNFDGATGCAVSAAAVSNPTTFSLETWFRTTTTTGGWLVGFGDKSTPTANGVSHDRNIYLRDNGMLTFGTWIGSVSSVTTTKSYNDGGWHQVVATLSSAGTRLYVDGALQGSSGTTTAENVTGYWHVGCDMIGSGWPGVPSSYFFAGDLDEVAIYTTALSATAVASHFRAGLGMLSMPAARTQSAPWAVWRMNEPAGTTLADDTANSHTATTTATGLTYSSPGVLPDDTAITYDGTNGCTVATTSWNDPELFSLVIWFKTTTSTGGNLIGFNPVGTTALPGSPYDRGLFMSDSGQVSFMVYPGSFVTVTSPASYNDGTWHEATATLGSHGQKLYVDGSLVASNANTAAYNYGGYWRTGCNNMSTWPSKPTSSYFSGTLDEAVVYATELDASTIAYRYSLVTRPAKGAPDTTLAVTPTLYWALDDASGNPTDSSGSSHPGTASGSGITRSFAPAIGTGSAWDFDGASGCVVSNASFVNPTTFTLSAWVRTTTASGGGIIGFTNGSGANTTATSWDRQIYLRNDGLVNFGVWPTAYFVVTSTSAINDGRWHQITATLGVAGQRLYVDGNLEGSAANTGAENSTGYWHAGCTKLTGWANAPTSMFLDGTLDEVIVDPVQLSDAAVRSLYLAGNGTHPALITGSSTISTLAGTGTASTSGDGGAATSATINTPHTVEVDAVGNIYIVENAGCRIRKVTPAGIISTVAGTGTCSSTGDAGSSTAATINFPGGVAVAPDGGYYLGELFGYRVRKVSPAGIISTYAGTGSQGTTGDGGAATSAKIDAPRGLAVDAAGNLYLAITGNCRIRKVTAAGVISTVAGTGTCSSTGDGGAATSATINTVVFLWVGPDGSLYLPEYGSCKVRKINAAGTISTIAGTGTCSSSGDGAAATSATLNRPIGIVGDGYGNLYVSEQNGNRVRKIDPAGIISTVAGTGTGSSTGDGSAASAATVNGPYGLALDGAGRLLVTELSGNRVRRVG